VAQVVSPASLVRGVFAALDAKDPAAVSARMTTTSGCGSVTSMWSFDDVVIAEMNVRYERLDGRKVTLPCCNVFRVRDGLVSDYRVYVDLGPVYA
jgi:hypothetical protein